MKYRKDFKIFKVQVGGLRPKNEIVSSLNDIMPGPRAYVTMIFAAGSMTPVVTKGW